MNPFRKAADRWFGRGDASIAMPPMDGAFRPNDLLDSAPPIIETPAPDCLAVTSRGIVVSSDRSLVSVDKPRGSPLASFDVEISALAGLPDGGAAVGLIDGRIVFVGGAYGGTTIEARPEVNCITALAAAEGGALLVANGSASNGPAAWKRDLMEKNASGSVWRIEPSRGVREQLAGNLAYPYGVLEEADSIVVSESWRSALTRIRARRERPQRAGAGKSSRLSQPPFAGSGQYDLARPLRAAKAARRIRVARRPLSSAHDQRGRRRLLDRAMPSRGPDPSRADAAGRRHAVRKVEALVAQLVLWIGRASRSRLSTRTPASTAGRMGAATASPVACRSTGGFSSAPRATGSSPQGLARDWRHDDRAIIGTAAVGDEKHNQGVSGRRGAEEH